MTVFATSDLRAILFLGGHCGILDGHWPDQCFIISAADACCRHDVSVDILNILLVSGHNSEQRQQVTGGRGKEGRLTESAFCHVSQCVPFLVRKIYVYPPLVLSASEK